MVEQPKAMKEGSTANCTTNCWPREFHSLPSHQNRIQKKNQLFRRQKSWVRTLTSLANLDIMLGHPKATTYQPTRSSTASPKKLNSNQPRSLKQAPGQTIPGKSLTPRENSGLMPGPLR